MARQIDMSQLTRHAEVLSSDHKHVGKVDHVQGTDELKLTKNDDSADNLHHVIPLEWIESIQGNQVILNKTASETKQQWKLAP